MKTKACKEASRDLDQAAGYLQKTSFRGMASSSSSSPSSSSPSPSRCLTMFDQCRKPGIGQSSAGSQTLATPLINTSIGNQTLALPETRQKFQSPKLTSSSPSPSRCLTCLFLKTFSGLKRRQNGHMQKKMVVSGPFLGRIWTYLGVSGTVLGRISGRIWDVSGCIWAVFSSYLDECIWTYLGCFWVVSEVSGGIPWRYLGVSGLIFVYVFFGGGAWQRGKVTL